MKKHFLLLTLSMLVLLSAAQAQLAGIQGSIKDEQNAPLPYATVMLLHAADSSMAKGAISDEQGKYELVGVKPGEYRISATMVGYARAFSELITISGGEQLQAPELRLAEATQQLEEVVVRGQLPTITQEPDRMVVDVEHSSLSSGGTALEVLEKSPGIVVDQDGNINMNGKQGVIVMIDGKRTFLSAADVSNMLRNMSSDAISKVELITNPSAKYDAAGNAGIINIRTRKSDTIKGTNGTLTLGTGYGKYEKANGGLTLNHRNGKWNVFGNYNFYHNRRFNETNIQRVVPMDGVDTRFEQEGYRPGNGQNNSFKVGADFFANEKNTLGFSVNGYVNNYTANAENQTLIYALASSADANTLDVAQDEESHYDNITYNLNYQRTFDREGEELTFNADYSRYNRSNDNIFENIFLTDGVELEQTNRALAPSAIDIYVGKLDYTLPLGKSRMELGWKSSYVSSDNTYRFENKQEGSWVVDPKLTSNFLYKENLNALYANWSGSLGKYSVTAGLRAEHTWFDAEALKDSYVSLFPSLFLQRPLGEKHQLGASYSRRIDRPSYQDLNPFVFFLDQYTYNKGNPYLQPEFTHQLQLTHTFNKQINTSFTASMTDEPMTDVIDQDNDAGASFQTRLNLGRSYNWNLNVNVPVQVNKWWSMQNNLSVFQNIYEGDWRGEAMDTDALAMNINLQNSFLLPYNFSAELGGFYRSPMTYAIIDIKSMYMVNAGISKKFLDNKATLRLNVNDIFNTMRFRGSIDHSDLKVNIQNNWESRQVRLSLAYSFGNKDIKPVRRQRGASADEQNRINSGEGN